VNDTKYVVKLDEFEGPLDLLLYLIHKNEVDIFDIPIFIITQQFLDYLDSIYSQGLEPNPEFLYMASVLVHIKSKMLIQSPAETEEEDPRTEIIAPLLDYLYVKELSKTLDSLDMLYRDTFPRQPGSFLQEILQNTEREVDADLTRLMEAFKRIIGGAPHVKISVRPPRWTVKEKFEEILSLRNTGTLTLGHLFSISSCLEEFLVFFVALLEVIFNGLASVCEDNGEIEIKFN